MHDAPDSAMVALQEENDRLREHIAEMRARGAALGASAVRWRQRAFQLDRVAFGGPLPDEAPSVLVADIRLLIGATWHHWAHTARLRALPPALFVGHACLWDAITSCGSHLAPYPALVATHATLCERFPSTTPTRGTELLGFEYKTHVLFDRLLAIFAQYGRDVGDFGPVGPRGQWKRERAAVRRLQLAHRSRVFQAEIADRFDRRIAGLAESDAVRFDVAREDARRLHGDGRDSQR